MIGAGLGFVATVPGRDYRFLPNISEDQGAQADVVDVAERT